MKYSIFLLIVLLGVSLVVAAHTKDNPVLDAKFVCSTDPAFDDGYSAAYNQLEASHKWALLEAWGYPDRADHLLLKSEESAINRAFTRYQSPDMQKAWINGYAAGHRKCMAYIYGYEEELSKHKAVAEAGVKTIFRIVIGAGPGEDDDE